MAVNPVPQGFHTVTPYLLIKDAKHYIQFLKDAFGATLIAQHDSPDGYVMNAELQLGSSRLMLGDTPLGHESTTVMLYLYVADADSAYQKALGAGGKSIAPMADQFYGDRAGALEDFAGNKWWIASRKEELSSTELAKRMAEQKPS